MLILMGEKMGNTGNLNEKGKPNLFEYATSELSQDAFLAWFFAWIRADSSHQISSAARMYLTILLNSKPNRDTPSPILEGDIDECEVQTQVSVKVKGKNVRKADLVLEVKLKGSKEKMAVIIEDKTHSSNNEQKLKDYKTGLLDKVENGVKYKAVIGILFKSGYTSREEREIATRAEYSVANFQDFLNILEPFLIRFLYYFLCYQDYIV